MRLIRREQRFGTYVYRRRGLCPCADLKEPRVSFVSTVDIEETGKLYFKIISGESPDFKRKAEMKCLLTTE